MPRFVFALLGTISLFTTSYLRAEDAKPAKSILRIPQPRTVTE